MQEKKFNKTEDYEAGVVYADFSDLPYWDKEDLIAYAEWSEGQLIHYGITAAFKAAKGDKTKLIKKDGRYLSDDGEVFRLNPKWRSGEKTQKQLEAYQKKLDKALAKFKATVNREPTAAELDLIKLTLS